MGNFSPSRLPQIVSGENTYSQTLIYARVCTYFVCKLAGPADLDLHATRGHLAELTPRNGLYPVGGLACLRWAVVMVLVLVLVAGLA